MTPLVLDASTPISSTRYSGVVDLTNPLALGEMAKTLFVVITAVGKLTAPVGVTIRTDVEISGDGEHWTTCVPGNEVLIEGIPVNGPVCSHQIPLRNPYPIGGMNGLYLVRLRHVVSGGSVGGGLYAYVTGQVFKPGEV